MHNEPFSSILQVVNHLLNPLRSEIQLVQPGETGVVCAFVASLTDYHWGFTNHHTHRSLLSCFPLAIIVVLHLQVTFRHLSSVASVVSHPPAQARSE